jgi:hypothetical protein
MDGFSALDSLDYMDIELNEDYSILTHTWKHGLTL